MPYQISADKVEKHSRLLDTLASKCLRQGKKVELTVPGEGNKNGFCWKLREVLVSAQEYPRNNYDRQLRDSVIVQQTTGDPNLVVVKPRPGAMLETQQPGLDSWQEIAYDPPHTDTPVEVEWAVEEDAEREHNLFKEALKAKFKVVLLEEGEVGEEHIRRYLLTPRPPQLPTKEEYHKQDRPSPLDPPEKRQRVINKYLKELEEMADEADES